MNSFKFSWHVGTLSAAFSPIRRSRGRRAGLRRIFSTVMDYPFQRDKLLLLYVLFHASQNHMATERIKNMDDFISAYPIEKQAILQKIRALIRQMEPDAQEAIVYGIPTFKLNERNLVHFSIFDGHVGFYPTPSGINAFKQELFGYKSAKGSVQFPLDSEIPYELIEKIVRFRVQEIKKNVQ